MKDRMLSHQWWNQFPHSEIQTSYLRFLKKPTGELTSSFTDSVIAWHKTQQEYKTVYEKYMGEL